MLGSPKEPIYFPRKALASVNGNLVARYLNLDICGEFDVVFTASGHGLYSDAQKLGFVFEQIADKGFNEGDRGRRVELKRILHFRGDGGHDMQSPMPILTRTIMNSSENNFEAGIRIICRFFSKVWLYRLQPTFKLIWEWSRVESCFLKARFIGTDGEFQSICVGGRLGALHHGHTLPDCSIESSSQLVKELSKFERDVILESGGWHHTDDRCPLIFPLDNRRISTLLKKSCPFICHGLSVQSGPLDTLPAIRESLRRHAAHHIKYGQSTKLFPLSQSIWRKCPCESGAFAPSAMMEFGGKHGIDA